MLAGEGLLRQLQAASRCARLWSALRERLLRPGCASGCPPHALPLPPQPPRRQDAGGRGPAPDAGRLPDVDRARRPPAGRRVQGRGPGRGRRAVVCGRWGWGRACGRPACRCVARLHALQPAADNLFLPPLLPAAALRLTNLCPAPPHCTRPPPACADVSSVRFVRNTPGLKPLVDEKAAKLERTRFIDRRLVQVVVAGSSPLVGECQGGCQARARLQGWCTAALARRRAAGALGLHPARPPARLHAPRLSPFPQPTTLNHPPLPQARRCGSCSSGTTSTAWWWPSRARASASRWGGCWEAGAQARCARCALLQLRLDQPPPCAMPAPLLPAACLRPASPLVTHAIPLPCLLAPYPCATGQPRRRDPQGGRRAAAGHGGGLPAALCRHTLLCAGVRGGQLQPAAVRGGAWLVLFAGCWRRRLGGWVAPPCCCKQAGRGRMQAALHLSSLPPPPSVPHASHPQHLP